MRVLFKRLGGCRVGMVIFVGVACWLLLLVIVVVGKRCLGWCGILVRLVLMRWRRFRVVRRWMIWGRTVLVNRGILMV